MDLNNEFLNFFESREDDLGFEVTEVRNNDSHTTNWYFI